MALTIQTATAETTTASHKLPKGMTASSLEGFVERSLYLLLPLLHLGQDLAELLLLAQGGEVRPFGQDPGAGEPLADGLVQRFQRRLVPRLPLESVETGDLGPGPRVVRQDLRADGEHEDGAVILFALTVHLRQVEPGLAEVGVEDAHGRQALLRVG